MLRTRQVRETGRAREALSSAITPLHGSARDYDSLIELIDDARFVMIGEASHGTHEFYAERATLTRRLIDEKGFGAVCIEGDWPDSYGLDLYSMFGSIGAVLNYLDTVDPEAAKRARYRYSCFDHFGEDSQAYGDATAANIVEACEQEAVRQLVDLRARALDYVARDGRRAMDDFFFAEQNARLVRR
ncbi:MAG: erythromycin esterase family protein [Gemmatimonadaceae bacterium]